MGRERKEKKREREGVRKRERDREDNKEGGMIRDRWKENDDTYNRK